MATQPEVDSLEKLQSAEQVRLLDQIDELRNQGLYHYGISLPQLIVCGEQSSGKSSLLEGLTRLRFPVQGGKAGTKFASEVVLRKESNTSISCTIGPSQSRSEPERQELMKFKRSFTSLEKFDLPAVIIDATEKMAFRRTINGGGSGFFEDVLRIRYSGPDLPSLTIVDLPGLIEDHGDGRGADLVAELVKKYMRDPKSIILAVVPADQDFDTTKVPKYLTHFDEGGVRTLGIITKPDRTEHGSDEEKQAIKLANNERKVLNHGWHVVRNRGHGTMTQSDAERDETERQYFTTGSWAALPKKNVGIASLRAKLSRILLQHIGAELPSLIATVQTAIAATDASLKAIGESRTTPGEQRSYLTQHAEKFQLLTNDALRGIYSNPFFALSNEQSVTRLRTEIQNLNIAFANIMYRKGHTWTITDNPPAHIFTFSAPANSGQTFQEYDTEFDDPAYINRGEFLDKHIGAYVRQSRPSGLPSLVNPWVIGEVFRQQSQAWGRIAQHHLERIYMTVKAYIKAALGTLMDHRTVSMLMLKQIQLELDQRWASVEAKLQELLVPYTEQDPITYDPGFVREIEETRAERHRAATAQSGNPDVPFTTSRTSPRYLLTETLDDFTNSEILDLMQTYYRHAISVFINNIAVLAIENCLIKNLAGIFSPSLITSLSDKQLFAIAAESEEVREERVSLEEKLRALKNGKNILNEHIATRPTTLTPTTKKPTAPTEAPPKRTYPKDPRPATPESQRSEDGNPEEVVEDLAGQFGQMGMMNVPVSDSKRPDSRVDSAIGTPSPRSSVQERRKSPPRRRAWPPSYDATPEPEDEEL